MCSTHALVNSPFKLRDFHRRHATRTHDLQDLVVHPARLWLVAIVVVCHSDLVHAREDLIHVVLLLGNRQALFV